MSRLTVVLSYNKVTFVKYTLTSVNEYLTLSLRNVKHFHSTEYLTIAHSHYLAAAAAVAMVFPGKRLHS